MAETIVLLIPTLALVLWNAVSGVDTDDPYSLIGWSAALAVLSLLEVRTWGGQVLVPDVPILVAMAIVLPPLTAATIAFAASFSLHEFGSRTDFLRGLNNRANTALGVLAASAVSRMIVGEGRGWQVAAAVTVALLIWTLENYITVCSGVALLHNIPLSAALRRLRPAKPADYALVLVAWWLSAIVLVASYGSWAMWSLAAFVLFAVILRQVLVRSETAHGAELLAEEQRQAVVALSDRIVDERRDERFRLAGELHDELIPRLFELSLLGRVLEQEMHGNTAESVIADVLRMRDAADEALDASREVIQGLRSNPLGPRRLRSVLLATAAELESQSHCVIQSRVEALPPMPETQELVIYQVAREALTNAARHSRGTAIKFAVFRDCDSIVLSVEDDGLGFSEAPAAPGHFGLLIMRERTAAAGGSIYIDSTLGFGTKVTAVFATDEVGLDPG